MRKAFKNSAFSVAEILIALGILTVAMVFIAGVFPVGIYFTKENVDKTTAAIIANEAFAKIKLYSSQAPGNVNGLRYEGHRDFNDWFMDTTFDPNDSDDYYYIDANAFVYPSEPSIYVGQKKYCWSAICRKIPVDSNSPEVDRQSNIQVTVFVCNRGNSNLEYYKADTGRITGIHNYATRFIEYPAPIPDYYGRISPTLGVSNFPQPARVQVEEVQNVENEIRISNQGEKILINNGDLIVDDYTGEIYRVLERYPQPDNVLLLDKKWRAPQNVNINNFYMWVVPPAAAPGASSSSIRLSGKSPCVEIYRRVIRF